MAIWVCQGCQYHSLSPERCISTWSKNHSKSTYQLEAPKCSYLQRYKPPPSCVRSTVFFCNFESLLFQWPKLVSMIGSKMLKGNMTFPQTHQPGWWFQPILKKKSQMGSFLQVKDIWNHHPASNYLLYQSLDESSVWLMTDPTLVDEPRCFSLQYPRTWYHHAAWLSTSCQCWHQKSPTQNKTRKQKEQTPPENPWKELIWIVWSTPRHEFHLDCIPCCVAWDSKIHPSHELSCNVALMTRLCRATFRQRLEQHVVAKRTESPSSVPVAWCPTSWRFKGHCPFEHEVGTHLKCQIPNFLKQFCQLEAAIWSVFGSELPTLLYDLLFAPCSRSAPETPSWSRSQFLKGKQTHFPIRKHWWKLVLLVCLAKTSEMIGDSCTFQKHKTSHQFYRWQIKTTLCNLFPKDCLLETHLKIETTHHSSKLLNIIQSITQPQANLHANLHAIDARRFLMVSASKVSRISHDRWKSCVWV